MLHLMEYSTIHIIPLFFHNIMALNISYYTEMCDYVILIKYIQHIISTGKWNIISGTKINESNICYVKCYVSDNGKQLYIQYFFKCNHSFFSGDTVTFNLLHNVGCSSWTKFSYHKWIPRFVSWKAMRIVSEKGKLTVGYLCVYFPSLTVSFNYFFSTTLSYWCCKHCSWNKLLLNDKHGYPSMNNLWRDYITI